MSRPPAEMKHIAQAWRARGFDCGIWTDPPGQIWKDYVHSVDELFMVIEGDVRLEIDSKQLAPAPGEEIFIPAGVLHTVKNVGTTPSRWYYGYRQEP